MCEAQQLRDIMQWTPHQVNPSMRVIYMQYYERGIRLLGVAYLRIQYEALQV